MSALIPGNLHTTAMAILPHEAAAPALELALSLDIPFWPQLPHLSYYEDMYVQAAEHFRRLDIHVFVIAQVGQLGPEGDVQRESEFQGRRRGFVGQDGHGGGV